jgi:hypothetical protein
MPPGRDSFRRNRVAPLGFYFTTSRLPLKTLDSKQNMSLSSRTLRAANPLASMNFIHRSVPRDGDPSASLALGFLFWLLLLSTRFLPPSWESTPPLIPSRSVICGEEKTLSE